MSLLQAMLEKTPIVRPIDPAEAMINGARYGRERAITGELNDRAERRNRLAELYAGGQEPTPQQLYATGNIEEGQQAKENQFKHTQESVKMIKDWSGSVLNLLDQHGFQPGSPDEQQFIERVFKDSMPVFQQAGIPITQVPRRETLEGLAGSAGPAQQAEFERNSKVRDQQALMPGDLEKIRAQAQITGQNQQNTINAQRSMQEDRQAFDAQQESKKQDYEINRDQKKVEFAQEKEDMSAQRKVNEDRLINLKKANDLWGLIKPESEFSKNTIDLIKKSTGSGIGAAADATGRFFGGTTEGAAAISELGTLAGQLTMLMPRGAGAQSDADLALMKQMAGDIANPNKTVEEKLRSYTGLVNMTVQKLKELEQPDSGQQDQPVNNASDNSQSQQNQNNQQPKYRTATGPNGEKVRVLVP